MPNNTDISTLITELRRRVGLSQEKLATRLRVSLPTINRWEKGKTKPDLLALHAIEVFIQQLGAQYQDLCKRYFPDEAGTAPQAKAAEIPIRVPRKRKTTRNDPGSTEPNGGNGSVLDTKSMEGLLWKAACSIRGEKDAPKFKDYILPLVFIKRLSDVFEDEIARLTETYEDKETARTALEAGSSVLVIVC